MSRALSSLSGASSAATSASSRSAAALRDLAQAHGGVGIGLARGDRGGGQRLEPRLTLIERGKLGLEAGDEGRQIVHADPVLPRQRAEREQALLGALELLRLEGGGGKSFLDLGAGGVGLAEHALERLGHGGEQRAAGANLTLDAAERSGKARPAGPLAGQRIERLVQLAGDLLGMHHQLAAGGESLLLAGLRIEALKLIEGMIDIVGIGADGGDLACVPRPLLLGRSPSLPG